MHHKIRRLEVSNSRTFSKSRLVQSGFRTRPSPQSDSLVQVTPCFHPTWPQPTTNLHSVPTDLSLLEISYHEINSDTLCSLWLASFSRHNVQPRHGVSSWVPHSFWSPGNSPLCESQLCSSVPQPDVWMASTFLLRKVMPLMNIHTRVFLETCLTSLG